MDRRARSAVVTGTILVVLGIFFLVTRIAPGFIGPLTWPWAIVGTGALFMVLALVTWTPGLAVPACIIGGIGGLLFVQNASGDWASWSYAWTLVPGFVGVGIAVSELLEGRPLRALLDGGWPILVSLLLFFVFGSFMGAFAWQRAWWGIALIGIGVLVILRPLLGGGRRRSPRGGDDRDEGGAR